MRHVLWLPAHPATGAASMDRYWRELEKTRRRRSTDGEELRIACPLGLPPARTEQKGRLERAWQKFVAYPSRVRWATRWSEVGVVHVLDHSFAHLLASVPRRGVCKIVTVHDLAPLRDPAGLTPAQQQRFLRIVGHAREADLLLADSRHSADETAALLGVEPAKLRVLPLGVDVEKFSTRPPTPRGEGLPPELAGRKVVLSVGAYASRKNLEILPEVFRQMSVRGVALLRIGAPLPPPLADRLRQVLGRDGLTEIIDAPDDLLVRAYQRADALIMPSRIEGFGFPVLEAMAAGCPVVCTNVTSLPEVAGDAALSFSPDDPTTAAGHLDRLLAEPACRAEAVAAGRRRVDAFSWDSHYESLRRIYEGLAAGKPLPAL